MLILRLQPRGESRQPDCSRGAFRRVAVCGNRDTLQVKKRDRRSESTPLELVKLTRPLPLWASFPGRWSEGQLLWLGQTPHRLTSIMESGGPATPNWNSTSIPSYWHSTSS